MKFTSITCLLGSIQAANLAKGDAIHELAQVETMVQAHILPEYELIPSSTSNDLMYALEVLGKSTDNILSWNEAIPQKENLFRFLGLLEDDIDNVDTNIAINKDIVLDAIIVARNAVITSAVDGADASLSTISNEKVYGLGSILATL